MHNVYIYIKFRCDNLLNSNDLKFNLLFVKYIIKQIYNKF